ncbi:MAG: Na+/H+ antiporter NhaA [Deltaproteobacteria bacterium]|nr:Na+/H+ antiporter NhaA [Deltaproteobacteria bacterium]
MQKRGGRPGRFEKVAEVLLAPGDFAGPLIRPFQQFFRKEAAGSILLISAALLAFAWSNSPFAAIYRDLLHTEVSLTLGPFGISRSLLHWINDGLMVLFFLIVGLEIKREMLMGELASFRRAVLPVAAAAGGMIVPALTFLAFNYGTATAKGWGIPMATDIAFALGAIAVLGRRVPSTLRIFLSAFAIADDIGAVIVIALFYTEKIVFSALLLVFLFTAALVALNRLGVRRLLPYGVLGFCLWLALLGSGIHATLAGIIIALSIPARGTYGTDKFVREVGYLMEGFDCPSGRCGFSILENEEHQNRVQSIELACRHVESPLQRMEHGLTPWVAFVIVPLFALVNSGLSLAGTDLGGAFRAPLSLGIAAGLTLGKPLGITLFSFLAVKSGLAELPERVRWSHVAGVGFLGGIGFTMSLFIAMLSFFTPAMIAYAKFGIFAGSLLSAACGIGLLWVSSSGNEKKRPVHRDDDAGRQAVR